MMKTTLFSVPNPENSFNSLCRPPTQLKYRFNGPESFCEVMLLMAL